MTTWGYTLSSEEFPPKTLVELGHHAEDAGFDFLTVSDHYHPWIQAQGHSPFAWTTIGGVGSRTGTIKIGTGVTCPILRYHPAIVAQAAASSASLLGAHRFFLGVGTGEWLNEHIIGGPWPTIETRIAMLTEAIAVMRELWTGATVNHHGLHFTVEDARLFTVPDDEIPVIWAASGTTSATAGAAVADGLWSTSPDPDVVDAYRAAGGKGPVYGQVTVCYAPDRNDAIDTAHRGWPNAGVPGQLSQDLATWTHFEQVAELITKEKVAERIPCGPDPEPIAEVVSKYTSAGFDHIHFHQVGPDQGGFIDFWSSTLSDSLQEG